MPSSPIERLNLVIFVVTRVYGDCRRILWPKEVKFEPCRVLAKVAQFPEKWPIAEIGEGPLQECSRGNKTAIELFLAGSRALALRSPINDVLK
jgi:hypothetical protein